MNASHIVLKALETRTDERGYVRTTMEELVGITDLSPRTIQRALTQLVAIGLILRRSKPGRAGGLLIRLETPSKTPSKPRQNPVKNDGVGNVVNQGAGSEGALSPPGMASETPSPSTSSRGPAHRPVAAHEIPDSGAELLYTGDEGHDGWRYMSPTMWIAPNGDCVSVKNMTPELKLRLGITPTYG